jgi:hypothetical protein
MARPEQGEVLRSPQGMAEEGRDAVDALAGEPMTARRRVDEIDVLPRPPEAGRRHCPSACRRAIAECGRTASSQDDLVVAIAVDDGRVVPFQSSKVKFGHRRRLEPKPIQGVPAPNLKSPRHAGWREADLDGSQ